MMRGRDPGKDGLSRRGFLQSSASTGVVVLGSAAGLSVLSGGEAHALSGDPDSPYPASSHEIATLKAVADTVVPNVDGYPGANEADAWGVLNDPFYGFAPHVGEFVTDLDAAIFGWEMPTHWPWEYGDYDEFTDLNLNLRTFWLEARMGEGGHSSLYKSWWPEMYEAVVLLSKLAFFGAIRNTVGTDYIGYPGPVHEYFPGADGFVACGGGGWGATFAAAGLPMSIPDNDTTGITSGNSVNGSGNITNLTVSLNITHTYQGDLIVTLISPTGTQHILHNGTGGGTDNLVLTDVDVTSYFSGVQAGGAWQLKVVDRYANDVGTLNSWSLAVQADGYQAGLSCQWDHANHSHVNNCPESWLDVGDGCDCGCQRYDTDCD